MLRYEKEIEAKNRELAELYNFEVPDIKGSPKLMENCDVKARKELFRRKTEMMQLFFNVRGFLFSRADKFR